MELKCIKMNPVENMTIIVWDEVPREKHLVIANKLMNYNSLHGEQVGFVEKPRSIKGKSLNTFRLQMMGGEFCGNATRSFAAFLVYKDLPCINKVSSDQYNVAIEVLESNELINCIVTKTNKENIFKSKIAMPLPERVTTVNFNLNNTRIRSTRVDFEGISHFIVDNNDVKNRDDFYNHVKRYMGKEEYTAFGIMFYDSEQNFMEPLVYVKMTNSRFWERSCASGTSALGIAKGFELDQSIKLQVEQPGGILEVEVNIEKHEVKEVHLDGNVEIVIEGIINIDDH